MLVTDTMFVCCDVKKILLRSNDAQGQHAYSHIKSRIICSQDPSPLAPAPPRPQPGCGPAPSSSDAHSVTLDILHRSLLDFSYPLTSCTSGRAAIGGDLEVLN